MESLRTLRASLLRPARTEQSELMDEPGHDPGTLADNLYDLRLTNQILGGARLTTRALDRLVGQSAVDRLTILDIATGGADIPLALRSWAARRGLVLGVTALDLSREILALARKRTPAGAIDFVAGDARRLPFASETFDVAICSLALHHMRPGEAVAMLAEMRRVSTRGVVVNDIVRWWPGYVGAWVLSRVFSTNPLTRHDGPLSVRRAYTRSEMLDLVRQAGLPKPSLESFLGYRVALAARLGA